MAGYRDTIEAFQDFIHSQDFPCVGAKSALAKEQITFCIANDIRTDSSDNEITKQLQEYAINCSDDSLFVSFIIIFQNTPPLSEMEFEDFLWQRLQAFHDKDSLNFKWDKNVSCDPDSPHFSMSIGGKGFYVVGLHPNASRPGRKFAKPALVFNLHSQFELLKENGSYTRIKEAICDRDKKLSGNLNPMLAEHGQSSEAKQYSGRVIEKNWKCPFHAMKT